MRTGPEGKERGSREKRTSRRRQVAGVNTSTECSVSEIALRQHSVRSLGIYMLEKQRGINLG